MRVTTNSSPAGHVAVDRTYRANPAYELVLLDRLQPAEQRLVGDVDGHDDLYGVLRPRGGAGLDPRSVSTDTALLYLSLTDPGPLPAYARARLGTEAEATLARLVLDGVLEVAHDGAFVSGAAAAQALAGRRSGPPRNRVADLSVAALRYGEHLGDIDEAALALRLYCYGRLPVSPPMRHRLGDRAAVARYLGLHRGGNTRAVFDAAWSEVPAPAEARRYWRSWQPRASGTTPVRPPEARYKLYVSPSVEALPGAVATIARTLAGLDGVPALKIGVDLDGICRPDKVVVYFDRLEALTGTARAIARDLSGCPAHGVPFTAAVTADGLLSWAADPPVLGTGEPPTSWRMWVAERLAAYLLAARRGGPATVAAWEFALERLRLAGIDTDTWVPTGGMWGRVLART